MNTVVIIPCYNTAGSLPAVLGKTKKYCRDILVIDDGSLDNTAAVAKNAGVEVLQHGQNRGKGAAILTGLEHALKQKGAEQVIFLDGDGQHDPGHIPDFLEKARKSRAGVIIGTRLQNTKTMPFARRLSNRASTALISAACRKRISDSQSGYRLYKREVFEKIKWPNPGRYETETELLIRAARAGFGIESVPIKTIYQNQNTRIRSNFAGGRDTWRITKVILKNLF